MSSNPQLAGINPDQVTFQNFADDTNLDAYSLAEIWTRSSTFVNQVWRLTKVGTYAEEDVYTITSANPTNPNFLGKNIEATIESEPIGLADAEPGKLSQRWLLRPQYDQTVILSMKYMDYVITGHGKDCPVTLQPNVPSGDRTQMWTPYQKGATMAFADSKARARVGV
ncbi:RICIN domain-containing protein [Nocardia arizonensis]|uniref:RICIN domain-containing protein n=1 Tax=Nocardia arizonensis TaxID=1141647 RepID=UPI0006D0CD46|nr:RICIN domain-containing protein [Nocardia arizonensis]